MNKVALKIPRMIKILKFLKITIIASKPLNLAMLEWYLGLFFSDCKDILVMLEAFKKTWWFLTSHGYFNQTHLSFFGAFMVLNFLNEKKGNPKQTLFVR